MELIPCGTSATITLGKIQGVITGITIRYNIAMYEITWFHDGEYKKDWFHHDTDNKEFTPGPHEKIDIGFIQHYNRKEPFKVSFQVNGLPSENQLAKFDGNIECVYILEYLSRFFPAVFNQFPDEIKEVFNTIKNKDQ